MARFDDYTKADLLAHLEDYLDATGRSSRKPFRCINPAHDDHNPSMSFDRKNNKVHCFSCGATYDIFDVIGIDYGLTSYPDQYKRACEYYGIPVSNETPKEEPQKQKAEHTPENMAEYFAAAHSRIGETTYHRGLNRETLDRFNVGFDPAWKHPKRYSDKASPRLIIPTGEASYIARYAGEGDFIGYDGQRMSKGKVGAAQIFNFPAIFSKEKPVFIVEGELDAMSIEQSGFPAVGLGSTTGVKHFLSLLQTSKRMPTLPVIVALDNEENEATKKAAADLLAGLDALGVSCCQINFYGESKDANEYLQTDPAALFRALDAAAAEASRREEEAKDSERELYVQENCAASHIQEFLDGISESVNTPVISTGIDVIDEALDGGLYPGLYFIGAISSLGKTSLVLQIADNIAKTKHDVLFFSLEMARSELMAKSISRHTYQIALEKTGRTQGAKTARGITDGNRWEKYSANETAIIKEAVKTYASYADHLFITEAVGRIGTRQIREAVQKHISLTGVRPVVFIDYLQILTAPDEEMKRATDKQITDANVTELKQISRDYNIPIFAVSSLNRASYREAMSMEAFKESGAIEYGSDVLIGLQLEGVGKSGFDVNAAKSRNPRQIEFVVLKNRNGPTGSKATLSYYPLFNCFMDED